MRQVKDQKWKCNWKTRQGGMLTMMRRLMNWNGGVASVPTGPSHFYRNLFILSLLWLVTLFSLSAGAATLTVTNLNDSGSGSLRQTIANANSGDTINFAVTGTITLTSDQIVINKNLTIQGPSPSQLAISGNKTQAIFRVCSSNAITVTINGLTIMDGRTYDPRTAGITNCVGSTLTVSNSILYNNSSLYSFCNPPIPPNMCFGAFGGGIHNSGTLTVINSTLSHNTAGNYGYGGGIDNGGTLTVINSTLSENSAGYEGGGIHNTGTLKILNSTLSDNDSNVGGGINNDGTLTVINSTLSGNKAQLGGGIFQEEDSTLTIINSTLSGNSAQSTVGGTGGGIYNYGTGSVSLANTLVANNTAQTSGAQCAGTIIDNGHNLDSGNTCGFSSDKGSLSNTDPLLKPLADNGGPTQTMALLTGSPAINAGDNTLIPADVTTDQRGAGFPRIVGGTVDIGAVEKEGPGYPLTVTKTGGNGTVSSTPAGINCGATCSANFSSGTLVTLAAKADAGYSFTGWAGDCNGATCTVTMTAAKHVTALFAKLPTTYTLTVTKAGAGLGTVTSSPTGINCGTDCSQPYNPGTAVTLTPTAMAGSVFAGWTGCTTVNGTKCTVVMTANKTVKAAFARPVLTVTKWGKGSGTVTSSPAGVNCGADCSEPYDLGARVILTAKPAAGSAFVGWSGACTGIFPTCLIGMRADQKATATFGPARPIGAAN